MKSNPEFSSPDQYDPETPWAFYFFMAMVGLGILVALGMLLMGW